MFLKHDFKKNVYEVCNSKCVIIITLNLKPPFLPTKRLCDNHYSKFKTTLPPYKEASKALKYFPK